MTSMRYVVALMCTIFVPSIGWLAFSSAGVQSRLFEISIDEEAYLNNLRDPELGCRSLPLRRAELVVLGDSHSYAGWNFRVLQDNSGRRVGACALGGLYMDSVPLLLEYVLRASPSVSVLILGVSPRMFWDSAEKGEQVSHHAKAIPAMSPDAKPFLRQRLGLQVLPYDREPGAVLRHLERIEGLSESAVAARLNQSRASIRTLRDWDRRLKESRFSYGTRALANRICSEVRRAGVKIWVIHIPESPDLESKYGDGIWRSYKEALAGLLECADKAIIDKSADYGLGNRHYVNRQLLDTHDYGMWDRPLPLTEDSAFDADHMNPIGAKRFTSAAIARLLDR